MPRNTRCGRGGTGKGTAAEDRRYDNSSSLVSHSCPPSAGFTPINTQSTCKTAIAKTAPCSGLKRTADWGEDSSSKVLKTAAASPVANSEESELAQSRHFTSTPNLHLGSSESHSFVVDDEIDDRLFAEFLREEVVDIVEGESRSSENRSFAALEETWDRECLPTDDRAAGQSSLALHEVSCVPQDHSFDKNNEFLDADLDAGDGEQEMMELADKLSRSHRAQGSTVSESRKLQWNPPKDYRPCKSSQLRTTWAGYEEGVTASRELSSPSPRYVSAPSPSSTSCMSETGRLTSQREHGQPIPFVDASDAPAPVKCRSPIPGLVPHGRIFTHFRLGSALNHVAAVWRQNNLDKTLLELYAKVIRCHREGFKQHFVLADVFYPSRTPRLQAEWVGWKGLPRFELAGSPFLDDAAGPKMARVVGRIVRDIQAKEWRMCVLSVWEASWDDIEAVREVVYL